MARSDQQKELQKMHKANGWIVLDIGDEHTLTFKPNPRNDRTVIMQYWHLREILWSKTVHSDQVVRIRNMMGRYR